ncbi:hypothetical protein R84981_002824 [Carnimonas sp. R-84981]|uniref:phage neck terminator protein n=1 Tax=Carnimonas bestiolae TaxID=3402172 RepID=UPI003EDC45FD
MANDSTEPGYLLEQSESAQYDINLDRILSRWLRSIVDYPPQMVRARWQKYQTSIEDPDTDWCAFGVIGIEQDANPALIGADDQQLWRHEVIDCMASFYGPHGMSKARQFTDLVMLEQNNETLKGVGLTMYQCEHVTPFPELINNQWVRRYDVRVHLRRKVVRSFAVKSLTDAPVQFFGE